MRGFEPMIGSYPYGAWLWLILAIAVVALVSWLVATAVVRRGGGAPGAPDSADAILRGRLARGEISAEEYAETRRVLGLK
jgi:uncharacterized membrane protein